MGCEWVLIVVILPSVTASNKANVSADGTGREDPSSGAQTQERAQGEPTRRRHLGELYDVNAIKMLSDPEAFGAEIADPGRYRRAEANIAARRVA